MPTPLNGTKTHPLSEHAKDKLRSLARLGPMPVQEINAGVWSRFQCDPAGPLAESVMMKSPYAVHKGGNIPHAKITEAGRKAIA